MSSSTTSSVHLNLQARQMEHNVCQRVPRSRAPPQTHPHVTVDDPGQATCVPVPYGLSPSSLNTAPAAHAATAHDALDFSLFDSSQCPAQSNSASRVGSATIAPHTTSVCTLKKAAFTSVKAIAAHVPRCLLRCQEDVAHETGASVPLPLTAPNCLALPQLSCRIVHVPARTLGEQLGTVAPQQHPSGVRPRERQPRFRGTAVITPVLHLRSNVVPTGPPG